MAENLSRRAFLQSAAVAAGVGALSMSGCAPGATPASGGGDAAELESTQLKLIIWPYEPELVRENLDFFEEQNPDLKVEMESTSGDYLEKLLAMFSAGTPMDTMYVRDQYYASWFDADFIKPIEGLDGLEELDADTFQQNLDSMSYQGHRLGTCYYTDFMTWAFNADMLHKADLDDPPLDLTLDDLRSICETIKSKGVMDYPLEMAWQRQSNAFWEWWAWLYASDGTNITEDLEIRIDEDEASLEILEWWVAAANEWNITNANANMETAATGELTGFYAEQSSFFMVSKYDLERANAPERSNAAREGEINVRFTKMPSLNKDDSHTSVHWTRMYCLSSTSVDPEAAWRLIYYLGGKDQEGEYFTAKRWFLLRGLGFPFKSLWDDQEIQDKLAAFADPGLVTQLAPMARPREGIRAPWYSEWDLHHQAVLQDALLQKISPEEALSESAKKARELKDKWAT
ncbi:ABC transporter substrate-binding protein [Chloroflexi bacterium TSY]|nr:ABC transporter substrate-binding protein [Chloroflexi bacterium TSY]